MMQSSLILVIRFWRKVILIFLVNSDSMLSIILASDLDKL